MPYADNQGVGIHYLVEGAGPPLVLQHGFMQSLEDWFETGYVDALKDEHRVILVDARGHGRSDKPHDVAGYRLGYRVSDVVAVLNDLDIEKADYWGYSMGGWIGFGAAEYAPERFNRLVIGGGTPFALSLQIWRDLIGSAIARGHAAFINSFEEMIGAIFPSWRARLESADLEAYLASVDEDRASHEAVLAKIAVPTFLYAGDADPRFAESKIAAGSIRDATLFSLPGLNHLERFVRSDLVLPSPSFYVVSEPARPSVIPRATRVADLSRPRSRAAMPTSWPAPILPSAGHVWAQHPNSGQWSAA
jgi:pimeloyl-ACP methyl ester carboxylesterase